MNDRNAKCAFDVGHHCALSGAHRYVPMPFVNHAFAYGFAQKDATVLERIADQLERLADQHEALSREVRQLSDWLEGQFAVVFDALDELDK